MRRIRWIFLVALFTLLATAPAAYAQKRVALVVGNSAYRYTPELDNPKNDAADMAATLKKHGFEVIEGVDLDKTAFERKVGDFAVALRGADAGVFFYAGHGLQVAGVNYLVPVDARAEDEVRLDLEMVRVETVHKIMERQSGSNVLFLDACRDNPLARNLARKLGTRSAEVGRGLRQVEAGAGTLISFATQPGNVALDGTGRNSPYTGALIKHLVAPKGDLNAILVNVRNDVMQATRNRQVPWENSALTDQFYFGAAPKGSDPAGPTPGQTGLSPAQASEAAGAWALVKDSSDLKVLDAYRRQYGTANPLYDRFAEARIEELRSAVDAARKKADAEADARERERLAALRKQEEEKQRAEAKRKAEEEAARRDRALAVRPGSGESFRDCPECPEMVVVPAGSFTMGSPASEEGRSSDEGPQRTVTIARPLAVGRFEVTFAEWHACVAADGCKHKPETSWGRGRQPVMRVSWDDITREYLPWLNGKTGKTYRLLTEAEWEYAARAGTTTPFWWGTSISTKHANYDGNSTYGGGPKGEYRQRTVPVDSFAANAWGLHNVHGNVWEWVQDCWNDSYNGAPSDGSAWTTGDCSIRVLRGGSWNRDPRFLRSADRGALTPELRSGGVGFRVGSTF